MSASGGADPVSRDELKRIVTGAKEHFGSTPDVYVPGAGVFEPVRTLIPERVLHSYANHDVEIYKLLARSRR
jgi:hypothetical protein